VGQEASRDEQEVVGAECCFSFVEYARNNPKSPPRLAVFGLLIGGVYACSMRVIANDATS
jgi:hypothetical protein